MYIKKGYNFNDLKNDCWSGAIYTLKRTEKEKKEEKLLKLLEEHFKEEVPTITEINDFLWFETEYIYSYLEIEGNE